jgi:hypothetical protein
MSTQLPSSAVACLLVSSAFLVGCYRPQVDHLDAEYIIDGRPIHLVDGVADIEAAPGSATRIVTRYFGNEMRKDLDGDGQEDIAFLVTQQTGGTGTFYYVVAALATEESYRGSHGILLGDRIAPQTTVSGNGRIVIVNYADRAPGEPFTSAPSIGKSVWLLLDPATMQFGEVAQDFAGEADPARMRLDMKTWAWIRMSYADGREIVPRQADRFTLTFAADGTFAATTATACAVCTPPPAIRLPSAPLRRPACSARTRKRATSLRCSRARARSVLRREASSSSSSKAMALRCSGERASF